MTDSGEFDDESVPICEFYGTRITESGQKCDALDDGVCRP